MNRDFKSIQSVKTLSGGFNSTGTNFNKAASTTASSKPGKGEVWVKKWVDYSSKYGLGYLLSNGQTGVFFNDSTKIIFDPKLR